MTHLLRHIFFSLALLCTVVSCSDDGTNSDQMEDIVEYLTTKHDPLLISEQDIASGLYYEPEFYTYYTGGAYRYIRDYYGQGREDNELVESGTKLSLTIWCYYLDSFIASSNLSPDGLYYTNDASYEDALAESGLNTTYWPFEPTQVTVGSGDIIKGVDLALVGCRVGDTIEVYMSYEMCYDDEAIGLVEIQEGAVFVCKIDNIID